MRELKGLPIGNCFISHGDHSSITITLYTSRVALVLGNNDENLERYQTKLKKRFPQYEFTIEVKEIKKPELSAATVADAIARQIEKKMPYRRVVKNSITKSIEKGAEGIKVIVSGRLGGAEIARRETFKEGNIPTQKLRSDIEYTAERAQTLAGTIGVKVWIYRGDIIKQKKKIEKV
jgi:small subunit ribosomal protein S3